MSRNAKKKKKVPKSKPINWRKVLKRAKELEEKQDAQRAVELIKELYHLVIVKHGKRK